MSTAPPLEDGAWGVSFADDAFSSGPKAQNVSPETRAMLHKAFEQGVQAGRRAGHAEVQQQFEQGQKEWIRLGKAQALQQVAEEKAAARLEQDRRELQASVDLDNRLVQLRSHRLSHNLPPVGGVCASYEQEMMRCYKSHPDGIEAARACSDQAARYIQCVSDNKKE